MDYEKLVRSKLDSLVDGSGDRLTVERWAVDIVRQDDPPEMSEKIWKTIGLMCWCEERDGGPNEPYIYGVEDFKDWLRDLDL